MPIDPREVLLGTLTRIRLLAPIGLLLWLFGIDLTPGVRLFLAPAVLLVFALDTIAHPDGTVTTVRARPAGGAR